MNLKQKYGNWALVTGASSGIGEEFAKQLACRKMNLILVARRKEKLENLSLDLKKNHGIETLVLGLDLSKENSAEEVIERVGEREVGILINNAGAGSVGEFYKTETSLEAGMVKLNCVTPTILTHHFVKPMIERRRGAIIFLGSLLAFQPTPFSATYSATKVFNSFLGDALWYELKEFNIDVLSLNPGGTKTAFLKLSDKFMDGFFLRTTGDVVNTALKALGKKPSVVDGFINKFLVTAGKLLPRKLLVNVSGFISRIMHKKKNENEK